MIFILQFFLYICSSSYFSSLAYLYSPEIYSRTLMNINLSTYLYASLFIYLLINLSIFVFLSLIPFREIFWERNQLGTYSRGRRDGSQPVSKLRVRMCVLCQTLWMPTCGRVRIFIWITTLSLPRSQVWRVSLSGKLCVSSWHLFGLRGNFERKIDLATHIHIRVHMHVTRGGEPWPALAHHIQLHRRIENILWWRGGEQETNGE